MRYTVCLSAFALLVCSLLPAQVRSNHVVVLVEENHSYSRVIGNSHMPYFNSLAKKYGLAKSFYANTHPSIGNYFVMTTGREITNSDGYSSKVTANNIVRQLLTAGKTWKSYAESLPSSGYTGGDRYPYVKHHNPFAYFTDVANSSSEKLNLVPFTRFSRDLQNGDLPNLSFLIPNQHHNMHDCPTTRSGCTDSQKAAAADAWLKVNVSRLFNNSQFQRDGLLIVVWDEGNSSDDRHGGGHIAVVFAGPKAKLAAQSGTFYQHQSILRTIQYLLGLSSDLSSTNRSAPLMSSLLR